MMNFNLNSFPAHQTNNSVLREYRFDPILLLRLAVATVLVVLSLLVNMSEILQMVLLILAALIAGYDLVLMALDKVLNRQFLHSDVLIVIAAFVSYFIRFAMEGAAIVILYQIGLILIDYTKYRTRRTALEYITDDDTARFVDQVYQNEYIKPTRFENRVGKITGIFTKVIIIFAILYAIVIPWITNFSYDVSIHRGLIILVIATPLSIITSIYLVNLIGLAFVAEHGVLFHSAEAFELNSDVGTVVYDKDGIITGGVYKIDFINPGDMDSDTFLKMAAHIAYRSSDPVAQSILDNYHGEISEELVANFGEVPGLGCKILVNGVEMGLMTKRYCESHEIGIPIIATEGTTLYMIIAGKYVGHITLSEEIDEQAKNLINEFNDHDIDCILVSSEDKETCTKFVRTVDVTEFYYDYNEDQKMNLISNQKDNQHLGKILYLYRNPRKYHTDADLDAIYASSDDISDITIERNCLNSVIFSIDAAKRSTDIAVQNVIVGFVVKAILIALTLTGFCNLWFALFIDLATALGTILNSIRAGQFKTKKIFVDEDYDEFDD